jgi:type IV pilus assembly protein PilY1
MKTTRLSNVIVTIGVAAMTILSIRSGDAAPGPSAVVGVTNLDLADAPLFLSANIKPNLIMAIDDSGSMDFELSMRGNDGAAWWRTAASGACPLAGSNSFVGCAANGATDIVATGELNFNNAGNANATWLKYAYLFPNGINGADTSFQRRLGEDASNVAAATGGHFAVPPLPQFAWARSPEYNRAYFDPTITYTRWVNGGGFTFADANPTATRYDPVFGTAANAINLTRDVAGNVQVDTTANCTNAAITGTAADGFSFRVYTGMNLPTGTCLRFPGRNWESVTAAAGCAVGVNNGCTTNLGTFTLTNNRAIAVRYFPATFYLPQAEPLPARFGYTGTTLTGTAPDGTQLIGYQIRPTNFGATAEDSTNGDPAYTATQNYNRMLANYANWFQYYRKRHQALRAGLGRSFSTLGGLRVAGFPINSNTVDVAMADLDDTTARTTLYTQFYSTWVRSGGTPNRAAVANISRNFRRTNAGAPITHSCQKNFGMLFTDGFSNPPVAGDGFDAIGNSDGAAGVPYADGVSNTLADGVWRAYANPLRTGPGFPAGKVPVPAACEGSNPDPRLDCNKNLHMSFYAVTLNTRGMVFDPDSPVDPYVTAPTWPTTFPARHPSAVDDLWHAAINGRGQLLNARRPTDIADRLSDVLNDIVAKTGSAASASVNSGSINSETRVFQALFSSGDWSGNVKSYGVNTDGSLDSSRFWETNSAGTFSAPDTRHIITMDEDGDDGIPFRWSELDSDQRDDLDAFGGVGEKLLEYLRGDPSNEQRASNPGGIFRRREYILGDVVNSAPAFVGRPSFRYRDTLESKPYSVFRANYADRTGVVYVGANDGMLHAFDSETGQELFAYIPSVLISKLGYLSQPNYSHRYYVDGSPTTGDAFINGDWQTVLVGGLNKGGQAIYALNITDPGNLTESNAEDLALWQFTDEDDEDLGYTFSRPAIVRTHNGKWAAVFGNGYNNTLDDGNSSATGNAVLYIVDLEDGSLIRKIDTEFGHADGGTGRPNGLATPALVDTNGDNIVDLAYAGDLFGNLWKFDLRSTNESDWDVAYTSGTGKAPVFQARNALNQVQSITVRPEVVRGPGGRGLMVLFGTGRYLEDSDEDFASARRESFYGVLDRNSGVVTDIVSGRGAMTQQQIVDERVETIGGEDYNTRETTNNSIGTTSGWYLDLVSPVADGGFKGEKQVTDPVIRNGRVIFTTLVPNSDPCEYGGTSWLMALDAVSGGVPQPAPFEVDDITGIQTTVGITPKPAILASDTKEFAFLPGTTGSLQVVGLSTGPGELGRQSWRQIR